MAGTDGPQKVNGKQGAEYLHLRSEATYILMLLHWVLTGLMLAMQLFQSLMMVFLMDTSLFLEIQFTVFCFVLPALNIYFLVDQYMQEWLLVEQFWLVWLFAILQASLAFMNYVFVFGVYSSYFDLSSPKSVKVSAILNIVFSSLAIASFMVYSFFARNDLLLANKTVIDYEPMDFYARLEVNRSRS